MNAVSYFALGALMATLAMIVLRLADVITWSWWWVSSPVLALYAVSLFLVVVIGLIFGRTRPV